MIENHKYQLKIIDIIKNGKNIIDMFDCAKTEIEAVKDYSEQFNAQFPPATKAEMMYMLLGAEKCVEEMKSTLFKTGGKELKDRYESLKILAEQSIGTFSMMIPKGECDDN